MVVGMTLALDGEANKMCDRSSKCCFYLVVELDFKMFFNFGQRAKIDEIIYVETNINWGVSGQECSSIDTLRIVEFPEAKRFEYFGSFFVPVARGTL